MYQRLDFTWWNSSTFFDCAYIDFCRSVAKLCMEPSFGVRNSDSGECWISRFACTREPWKGKSCYGYSWTLRFCLRVLPSSKCRQAVKKFGFTNFVMSKAETEYQNLISIVSTCICQGWSARVTISLKATNIGSWMNWDSRIIDFPHITLIEQFFVLLRSLWIMIINWCQVALW